MYRIIFLLCNEYLFEPLPADKHIVFVTDQLFLFFLDRFLVLAKLVLQMIYLFGPVFMLLVLLLLSTEEEILIFAEFIYFMLDLLHFIGCVLLLLLQLMGLLLFDFLEFTKVLHELVIFIFMECKFLLLRLGSALLQLQLNRILMHRIPIQELFIAGYTDQATSLFGRIVARVGARLVQTSRTVHGSTELAILQLR